MKEALEFIVLLKRYLLSSYTELMVCHMILALGSHSPGLKENLNDNDDSEKFIKIRMTTMILSTFSESMRDGEKYSVMPLPASFLSSSVQSLN
jgi:hypothetical protein